MPAYRWAVTNYGHYWFGDALLLFATTDVTVNLTLHYTLKSPLVHDHTKAKRGFRFMADPKYCFVQWLQAQQIEPGYTLEHSFDVPGWEAGQNIWFHFEGTFSEAPTSSNTGIMHVVAFEQGEAFSMRHVDLTDREPGGVLDHANYSVTPIKLSPLFKFVTWPSTPAGEPTQPMHMANKAYVDAHEPYAGFTWLAESIRIAYISDETIGFGWTGIDLSAYVPIGVQGVYLHLMLSGIAVELSSFQAQVHVKKPGTTPDTTPSLVKRDETGLATQFILTTQTPCGLDNWRNLHWRVVAISCTLNIAVHLLGYVT